MFMSDNSFLLAFLSSSKHVGYGLLKDEEAERLTVEIEERINDTLLCDLVGHPGELDIAEDDQNMELKLQNNAPTH